MRQLIEGAPEPVRQALVDVRWRLMAEEEDETSLCDHVSLRGPGCEPLMLRVPQALRSHAPPTADSPRLIEVDEEGVVV